MSFTESAERQPCNHFCDPDRRQLSDEAQGVDREEPRPAGWDVHNPLPPATIQLGRRCLGDVRAILTDNPFVGGGQLLLFPYDSSSS